MSKVLKYKTSKSKEGVIKIANGIFENPMQKLESITNEKEGFECVYTVWYSDETEGE